MVDQDLQGYQNPRRSCRLGLLVAQEGTNWYVDMTSQWPLLTDPEHCAGTHGFFDYSHFFYRLRPAYDPNHRKRKKPKMWFGGGKSASSPRDLLEQHALMSTSPTATAPLGRPGAGNESGSGGIKKKKIRMSQSVIIDMDPGRKSDRAEVAMLHADIVHNARNA